MKLRPTLVALVLGAAAQLALALDIQPYTPQALAASQQAGKPVALHFHADWCPTCRAQEKTLASMKAEAGLDLTVFLADYDTEKALKRQFGVRSQSTLIALRGQKVTARMIGDTSAEGLRAALKSAL